MAVSGHGILEFCLILESAMPPKAVIKLISPTRAATDPKRTVVQ